MNRKPKITRKQFEAAMKFMSRPENEKLAAKITTGEVLRGKPLYWDDRSQKSDLSLQIEGPEFRSVAVDERFDG